MRPPIPIHDEDVLNQAHPRACGANKAWETVNGKNKPAYLDADADEQSRILTVMRRQHPSEYTDGEYGYSPDRKKRSKQSVGDLNLATWDDYRASLAERFIAANNPDWKLPPEHPTEVPRWWLDDPDLPELTVNHLNHLLYGSGDKPHKGEDARKWQYSGGHMAGYGWVADRPEFPEDWDEQRILQAAKEVCKQSDSFHIAQEMTVDACDMVVVFGKRGVLQVSTRRRLDTMIKEKTPDDVLLGKFVQVFLDAHAYKEADLLQSMQVAGEFACGFDFAMVAFKDLGISPPVDLMHAMMDSVWFEKDSYADDICQEFGPSPRMGGKQSPQT